MLKRYQSPNRTSESDVITTRERESTTLPCLRDTRCTFIANTAMNLRIPCQRVTWEHRAKSARPAKNSKNWGPYRATDMFKFLKQLFTKNPPEEHTDKIGETLTPWECAKLAKSFCPDCGHYNSLLEGPTGGMSVNTLCEHCHSEFNIAMINPGTFGGKNKVVVMGERISHKYHGRTYMYGLKPKQ